MLNILRLNWVRVPTDEYWEILTKRKEKTFFMCHILYVFGWKIAISSFACDAFSYKHLVGYIGLSVLEQYGSGRVLMIGGRLARCTVSGLVHYLSITFLNNIKIQLSLQRRREILGSFNQTDSSQAVAFSYLVRISFPVRTSSHHGAILTFMALSLFARYEHQKLYFICRNQIYLHRDGWYGPFVSCSAECWSLLIM